MSTIKPGSQVGPYDILAFLGAGGMGQVYRARDTRLNRDVAIKTLPDEYAGDPDRLARFTLEAQAVAALSHPNIAAIHELEHQDGSRFIVMELVEGETLADRLKRGPLDAEDALAIARQIAAACEAAHDKGIVHRDLKPANIKITPDGVVKVLDFGLAKVVHAPSSEGSASQSPTIVSGTMAGAIMGTAEYMSPEQARGRTIDRRTDVWAFGCVLYEMLTGRTPFTGDDVMQIIASILRADPAWNTLPVEATPLRPIISRCLQRDPNRRLRDMRDLRIALEDAVLDGGAITAPPLSKVGISRLFIAALVIAVVVIVTVLISNVAVVPPSEEPIQLSILPPSGQRFSPSPSSMSISPDGRFIAFIAGDSTRTYTGRLWVRAIDSTEARLVEGSEASNAPFWSPDSQWVAFFDAADRKLKKVSVAGGSPRVIADVTGAGGGRQSGTWNRDNLILLGMDVGKPLHIVPAEGGVIKPQTVVEDSEGHFRPSFLPDSRHFFFTALMRTDYRGVFVGSLDSPEIKPVLTGFGTAAQYVTGLRCIIYVRENALLAQPFNISRLEVEGDPIQIVESIALNPGNAASSGFSVADNGTLIYRPPAPSDADLPRQLAWFDRSGKQLGTIGEPDLYNQPRLSPDGRYVAAVIRPAGQAAGAVWLIDTTSGARSRLPGRGGMPLWSGDGKALALADSGNIVQRATTGEMKDTVIGKWGGFGGHIDDWSRDRKYIVGARNDPSTNRDVVALLLGDESKVLPLAATVADEVQPQISPDGKWIAFVSNETERREIFVQRFPVAGLRRQVSRSGGVQPRWRSDGKELFYVALDAKLTAIPVTDTVTMAFGSPIELFKTPAFSAIESGIGTRAQYDVAPDGKRILINVALSEPEPPPIHVLLNWSRLLKK